ncbi:MAG: hypothetical protein OXC41_06900 [Gammaproteobacteria bacterium]|nr:hypothetical protein [Gammaproteobacteria bacterium]
MKDDIERKRLFKEGHKLLDQANKILKEIFEDCHIRNGKKKAA